MGNLEESLLPAKSDGKSQALTLKVSNFKDISR